MQNFSRIHTRHHRKSGLKTGGAQIIQAAFVDKAPLLMLLLYGVTTLRVMSLPKRTRARSERPPAGPEKYTEVLRNDMSKQKNCFSAPPKMRIFRKCFVT